MNNYAITKNGKILSINKGLEKIQKKEIKRVNKIEGLYKDIICYRLK